MGTRCPALLLLLSTACGPSGDGADTAGGDPCEAGGHAAWGLACFEGLQVSAKAERVLPDPVWLPHGPVQVAVGDVAGTGVPQVYVGTANTITRLDGPGWTTATDVWTTRDRPSAWPAVGDLTGDGLPDLAVGLPTSDDGAGQVVVLPGPVPDPADWDTPHLEIKGEDGVGSELTLADLDADGALDLVAQGDGLWVRFGPLLADGTFDVATDAQWTDFHHATVGDITGDGVPDLVFLRFQLMDEACLRYSQELRVAPGPLTPGRRSAADLPLSLTPPAFTQYFQSFWDYTAPPVVGDADGDGLDDLVVTVLRDHRRAGDAAPLGAATSWSQWPEALVYRAPVTAGASPAATFALLGRVGGLADLDGDGDTDVLQVGTEMSVVVSVLPTGIPSSAMRLDGPAVALPPWSATGCTFEGAEAWTDVQEPYSASAWWVGDLDGDDTADAVLVTDGARVVTAGR